PLARTHPVQPGGRPDETEPVPLLIGEQGEHAVLERSAPHLRDERVLLRCGYYAQQGTWGCRVSQEPAPAHADNVPLVAVTLASRADIPLEAFERVAWRGESIDIAPEALERIDAARAAFLRLIEQPEITVYGVTSGYGDRAGVRLGVEERALQAKQAMHAAGSFGKPLPERVARGIVLARLANFLDGHAAVSARLATAVADLPDGGRLPSVPERGNGGSGEIVALAHLFGPLMERFELGEEEGLALTNGSPGAAALVADASLAARRRLELAYRAFALSVEAFRAPLEAYDPALEELWGDEHETLALRRLRSLLNT